jgi:hypothetical protein
MSAMPAIDSQCVVARAALFDFLRVGASCTQPLLPTLQTFTLCHDTDRIIALCDPARDIGVNFRLNKARSAVPEIKWLGELGIAADAAPERGAVERVLASEPGAQLRGIEPAWRCWFEIGHRSLVLLHETVKHHGLRTDKH